MFKQLGAAAAVVLVTTFGMILHGPIIGIISGLILATLLVILPVARTTIEVRHAKLASGKPHATPPLADVSSGGDVPTADLLIARLSGPLTFLSQGQLMRLLDGPPWPRYVVLEMSAVPFVESGGVNELEYLVEFLAIRGGKVVIVGCSLGVRDSLLRTGVVTRLAGGTLFTDLESGLDAVTRTHDQQARRTDLAQAAGW